MVSSITTFATQVRQTCVRSFRPIKAMNRQISLTSQEQKLRTFLLDVSDWIGGRGSDIKPELRFTGGWVRDKLLGNVSHDIDVGISSLTGEKFGLLMKEYLLEPAAQAKYSEPVFSGSLSVIKENPDKSKHLETAKTRIYGFDIDLVNLRKEIYSASSRTPTAEFGTPEEDAFRRDATINALFYNLALDRIEDPTGQGLRDMDLRVIRTPMEPFQTFRDDPLRVLRCVRFASRLGYSIDPEARESMQRQEIVSALCNKISRERIGDEFSKMLQGPDPRTALSLIDSTGLYHSIFKGPAELSSSRVDTTTWHLAYDLLSQIFQGVDSSSSTLCSMVLPREEDRFTAWLMAAMVPLVSRNDKSTEKQRRNGISGPVHMIREGLKLDNAATMLINEAFESFEEIIQFKATYLDNQSLTAQVPTHRQSCADMHDREDIGVAIRRWSPRKNSNWKLSVLLALLVEQARARSLKGATSFLAGYEAWLQYIMEMGFLDAHELRPILNGNEIMKATGRKGGPWLGEALDATIRWQLRHPNAANKDDARSFIMEKYQR